MIRTWRNISSRLALLAGFVSAAMPAGAIAQSDAMRDYAMPGQWQTGPYQAQDASPGNANPAAQPYDATSASVYQPNYIGEQGPQAQQGPRRDPLIWRLSISPRITYSDNAALDPDDIKAADGLASVYLSGGALIDRVRFTGLVNGEIQMGRYFDPATSPNLTTGEQEERYDRSVINQNITAAGTLKVIDNLAYFDMAASAREQAIDERSPGAGTSLAANSRQADAYSFSLSPYLFTRMPNDSTIEARYRYLDISIEDGDAVDGVEDFLNDSRAHEVLLEYSSGRLFDRFGFSVRAYANATQEEGSEVLSEIDYAQASLSSDLSYAMNRRISVIGTIGYDDVDTDGDSPFDDEDLTGVFWKAGAAFRPGRRTEAQLEMGERYGGTWVDALASYRYSSRLQFRLAANRRFLTTSQSQAGRFNVLQSETLSYAEELRQLQNLTGSDILDRVLEYNTGLDDLTRQQAGLSRADSIYADVIAQAPRTSIIGRVGFDRSDFGFQTIDTVSLSGQVEHRLSRRMNIYGRTNIQSSQTDSGGALADCIAALAADPDFALLDDDAIAIICANDGAFDGDADTITVLAGLDYLLFRDTNAFAELSRSQRFSDTPENEYEENAVTLGLTFDF